MMDIQLNTQMKLIALHNFETIIFYLKTDKTKESERERERQRQLVKGTTNDRETE